MPVRGHFNGYPILKNRQECTVTKFTDAAGTEISSMCTGGGFDYILVASANDGDIINFDGIWCNGTETQVDLYYGTRSDAGIVDLYIDDVLLHAGIDTYAAAPSEMTMSHALAAAVSPGWHTAKLVVNGKNVASTDYRVLIGYIRIR